MDLESTLIRAEVLFRKFQRLVEAIDKQQNFPGPRLRPAPVSSASSASSAAAAASPSSPTAPAPAPASPTSDASPPQRRETGKSPDQVQRVITPELRKLLSRDVDVLTRKEVAKQGDGLWMHKGK